MLQRKIIYTAVFATMSLAFALSADADGKKNFQVALSGYNETTLTLNSPGSGTFTATISKDEQSIDYVETYQDLGNNGTSTVTQSHIHFGRPGLTGGVVLFLCTNLTPPANVPVPPPCPTPGGTVKGTLTAANVIAVPGQGIDSGAAGFAEMVKAIRNGSAYANVHTTRFPSGEIRGPLGQSDDNQDDDNND